MCDFRGGFAPRCPFGDSQPGLGGVEESHPLDESRHLRDVVIMRLQGVACVADEGAAGWHTVQDNCDGGLRNLSGNIQSCPDRSEVKECGPTRDEKVLCGPRRHHRLLCRVRGRVTETQVHRVLPRRIEEVREVLGIRRGDHRGLPVSHPRPRGKTPLRVQVEQCGGPAVAFGSTARLQASVVLPVPPFADRHVSVFMSSPPQGVYKDKRLKRDTSKRLNGQPGDMAVRRTPPERRMAVETSNAINVSSETRLNV